VIGALDAACALLLAVAAIVLLVTGAPAVGDAKGRADFASAMLVMAYGAATLGLAVVMGLLSFGCWRAYRRVSHTPGLRPLTVLFLVIAAAPLMLLAALLAHLRL
jgi:hypothetical protein